MAYVTLPNSNYRLDLTVSVHRQVIAENRTEFRAILKLVEVGPIRGYWTGNSSSWSVRSPAGTVQKSGSIPGYNFGGYTQLVLSNEIISFNHNADGTFAARQWQGRFVDGGALGDGTVTIASVGAPTIPRATTPTVAGGFTSGATATITLPRASAAFTHDVSYKIGTKTGVIATGAGASTTWTPGHDLLTELPAAATGQLELTVVTKNGSTTIGTTKTPIPFTAAASVVPTVSGVAWSDQNPTVAANIGGFVQGLSLVKGLVTAAGVHGSTITEKRLLVGGQQFPESATFQPSSAGTITASGEATDSRGRVGTVGANFQVLAYEAPKLGANGFQVLRANSANVADDNGQYLRVQLHAIIASLIVGTQKNQLTIACRTRPLNGAWTTRNTINHGSLTYSSAFQMTGGAAFSTTLSYEVEITLTDKTGQTVKLVEIIPTAVVTLDLNGNAVGVGKMHERGVLDVAGDGYFAGDVYAAGITDDHRLTRYGETRNASTIFNTGTVPAARLPIASQVQVDAGASTTVLVTPGRLAARFGGEVSTTPLPGSPGNGFTINWAEYTVRDGEIHIWISVDGTHSVGAVDIWSGLPAELRPPRNTQGSAWLAGNHPGIVFARPAGTIAVAHQSGASRGASQCYLTYPKGTV